MKEKEMLINLIKNNIHIIKIKIKENSKFNEPLYISLKNAIRIINEDNLQLLQFEIDKVKELCPSLEESDITTLEFYKTILSTSNFKMGEFDRGQLRSVLAKVNTLLLDYEEKNKHAFMKEEQQIHKYEDLLEKIKNDFELTSTEIDDIYELLEKSDIDINDSIKIMRYIANETIKKIDSLKLEKNEVPEELTFEKTNLSIEDLINLFHKHNSNFSLLSKSSQKELQQYGNLTNIEQIFNTFEKYNINSVNPFVKKIGKIFIYSNAQLIEKVFETCLKYNISCVNDNGVMKIELDQLLKTPSKFVNRKRKWKKKGTGPSIGGESDSEIGTQEDFIKNIEYFASEGLDVSSAYQKSFCYFDLPHEHIKIGVKNFKLYGIPKELYLSTLSSFANRKQADVLDQFIELGYFDYVKDNLSRAILLPDNPMFYKIARANQLDIKIPRTMGKGMPSDITYDSKEYLGINQTNGATQTRRYFPKFINKSYFDEAVATSDNNSIILVQDDEFIKELDKKYRSLEDEMVYQIAGVRISRLKVMRIYNTLKLKMLNGTLDSLMYTITRNSIITKEQYNAISREISMLYNGKKQVERRSLVR